MGKARDLANLLTNGLVAPTKLSAGAPTWNAASSVGIKATPNASWASDYAVLQMNSTGSINGNAVAIVMANNTYYDGTNARYLTTGPASDYFQYNGSHTWRYAASGTAGAVATMVLGMTQDPAGNLGLGVTPSAWGSSYRAIDLQGGGSFFGAPGDANQVDLSANTYNDNTNFIYKATSFATLYRQNNGGHEWHTAPSGTAGNAITFTQAMAVGHGTSLALAGATSQTGTGITFPATQSASSNANTLDDYEEGTWTPFFATETGGPMTVTYTAQLGFYTKIGRLVTIAYSIAWSARTASGSVLQIAGQPFSASNVNNATGYVTTVSSINFANRGGVTGTFITTAPYSAGIMSLQTFSNNTAAADPRLDGINLGASGSVSGGFSFMTA